MGDSENGFGKAMRIRKMDVALDHVISHQPVDDIGTFALCGAEDGFVTLLRIGYCFVAPVATAAVFVVFFVMAWSPFRRSPAGISWVEHPGDYANRISTTLATAPAIQRS